MAKKNDWVRLHIIALSPEQRAPQVPQDTKKVPLEMWVKGKLNADAQIGQTATVTTRSGRTEVGTLVEVNPCFTHSFGDYIPELAQVGDTVREIVFGGSNE